MRRKRYPFRIKDIGPRIKANLKEARTIRSEVPFSCNVKGILAGIRGKWKDKNTHKRNKERGSRFKAKYLKPKTRM